MAARGGGGGGGAQPGGESGSSCPQEQLGCPPRGPCGCPWKGQLEEARARCRALDREKRALEGELLEAKSRAKAAERALRELPGRLQALDDEAMRPRTSLAPEQERAALPGGRERRESAGGGAGAGRA